MFSKWYIICVYINSQVTCFSLEPPALGLIFKCDNPAISARPVQFTKVAHISGKGFDEAFFWYPIPPPGYASFGCVVTTTDYPPKKECVCCPRLDLVSQTNVASEPISRSSSSKGTNCWSIWKVENQVSLKFFVIHFYFTSWCLLIFLQACTFLARSDHIIPTTRLAYKFSDYAKPKARENVAAELKLGLLSLSVLDNFCGTVSSLVMLTLVLERRRFSLLIYCINAYFWFGSDDATSWHNSDKYESCYAWEFSGNECCSNMFNCFIHIQQTNRGMGASNWTIWCHIQVILCNLYTLLDFKKVLKKMGGGYFIYCSIYSYTSLNLVYSGLY